MNGYMRELNTRQKLRYLWDYYRIRIGLGVLAVIAVIGALAHARTKPDVRLTVGMINVSSGNAAGVLKDGYLDSLLKHGRKDTVHLAEGYRIADRTDDSLDFEYNYASNIKLLAQITDRSLDVVLMDRAAMKVMERNRYLMRLPDQISGESDGYAAALPDKRCRALFGGRAEVCVGIIASTPRKEEALRYVRYLLS